MACCGSILAAGTSQGSVGLLCTALPAAKAKLSVFESKHSGAVRQCFVRVSSATRQGPETSLGGLEDVAQANDRPDPGAVVLILYGVFHRD